MTDDNYARKLDEVDRLPNDPDVPIQSALIWRLPVEVSKHELRTGTVLSHGTPPTIGVVHRKRGGGSPARRSRA
jgi:hypothetical protein